MPNNINHLFHLVNQSPLPLTVATGVLVTMTGISTWFYQYDKTLLTGLTIIILTIIQWWRDIIREGTYQGLHI